MTLILCFLKNKCYRRVKFAEVFKSIEFSRNNEIVTNTMLFFFTFFLLKMKQERVHASGVRGEGAEGHALAVGAGPHAARPRAGRGAALRHARAARRARAHRHPHLAALQRVSFATEPKLTHSD